MQLIAPSGEVLTVAGEPGRERAPLLVAYGCGVDSTAMLLLLAEAGLFPDRTLFADTGGEKPSTYKFLFWIDEVLRRLGYPADPNYWERPPGYDLPEFDLPPAHPLNCVRAVRNDGKYGTLERNCRDKKMLPSMAYGRRGCSEKYKLLPQHKWTKSWGPARRWWGLDGRNRKTLERHCVKLLGYDASETHRSDLQGDGFYDYVYPLRQWGLDRAACVAAITRFNVKIPPKSACWFCPSSKKPELIQLSVEYPALLERALAMEDDALAAGNLQTVKGLGRGWSWREELAHRGRAAFTRSDGGCVCHGEVYEGEGIDSDEEEL